MADSINTLLTQIKTDLRAAMAAGELKDTNTPVRDVQDDWDYQIKGPQQLPLIQYGEVASGSGGYAGDAQNLVPFAIRFIVWVPARGGQYPEAVARARNLRDSLLDSLHNRRPFGKAGAARQALTFQRETIEFRLAFAAGLSVIVSGNIMEIAGS